MSLIHRQASFDKIFLRGGTISQSLMFVILHNLQNSSINTYRKKDLQSIFTPDAKKTSSYVINLIFHFSTQ